MSRLVGCIVSQYEDTEAYTFGLTTLKEVLDDILKNLTQDQNAEYDLKYFVADAGD